MNLRRAPPRVAAAAIDLGDELAAVGQRNGRHGADGRTARRVLYWMARTGDDTNELCRVDGQDQMQAKESSGVRGFVMEEERIAPLVC